MMFNFKRIFVGKLLPLIGVVLLFSAAAVRAEIVLDSSASSSNSEPSDTITWQHSVGVGDNRLLVVSLMNFTGSPHASASSVTYAGLDLTRQVLNGPDLPNGEIWTLVAPPTGTADVVVTYPDMGAIAGASMSFFGVNQTAPVRDSGQTRTDLEGDGTVSASVDSQPGDVAVDLMLLTGGSISAGTGQTEVLNFAAPGLLFGVSTKPGEPGSTTVSWNFVNNLRPAALTVISIVPAAAAEEETPTPAEMIGDLAATVRSLNLHRGTETALLAKLNAALDSLAAGNVEDARSSLNAFISHCNAQRGKKLTNAQADALIVAANDILAAL